MTTKNNPEDYPTDVKLLLCQLVYDSREENTWQDILDRLSRHPIVTQLHKMDLDVNNVEELPTIVTRIINDTLIKFDNTSTKRSRGRQSEKDAITRAIDPTDSVELKYFQQLPTRETLARCCTSLHHHRVEEIKKQLALNKKQFALLLKPLT